jgi:hypothetical protein
LALPAVPQLTVTWCDTSRSASVNLEVMKLMKIMLMMVMKLKMNYTVMQFLSFFSSLYRPGFGMVWYGLVWFGHSSASLLSIVLSTLDLV